MLLGASGQLGREWQLLGSQLHERNILFLPYTSSQLDISRFEGVSREIAEIKPEMVINCAAYTKVDRAEKEREQARTINAEAVSHLAEQCRKQGSKLIHYSTDYVFPGKEGDRDRFPKGYPEDHPADPVNWYGQTKWEGEQAIRASGCHYLIIRTTWLCGRFGNNFVKTMLKYGRERDELQVVDDQWGSPSFADEVVKHTFKLIEEDAEGTYHLTSGGLTNWWEFAMKIFEYSDISVAVKPVSSEEFPTDAPRPKFSKLDTRRAEEEYGIKADPWEKGLKRLLKEIES